MAKSTLLDMYSNERPPVGGILSPFAVASASASASVSVSASLGMLPAMKSCAAACKAIWRNGDAGGVWV